MTTLQHDDPRLTAYALGELPADERAEIELQLAGDPGLRAEVEQIRALSGDLAQGLAAELRATPTLTRPQRATITRAATPRSWRVVGWSVLTSAVAATIAVMVIPTMGMVRESAKRVELTRVSAAPEDTREVFASADSVAAPTVPAAPAAPTPPVVPEGVGRFANAESGKAFSLQERGKGNAASSAEAIAIEQKTAAGDEVVAKTDSPGSTGSFMAIREAGGSPRFRAIGAGAGATAAGDAAASTFPSAPAAAPAAPAPASAVASRKAPASPAGDKTRGAPASSTAPTVGFRLAPNEPQPASPTVTPGGETYNQRADHAFLPSQSEPLSTFGLDVDTASYGNVRRMIEGGRLPPRDAVRVEELLNYFPYEDVPAPTDGEAFGVKVEVAPCPWQPAHQLARIAVRGQAVTTHPALNLVFLIDVSGSMKPDNRLPLIKTGLTLLANSLGEHDHVTIVTYAGSAGVALATTPGNDQRTILKAVDRLTADGSTNGGSGIQMAYDAARSAFVQGGVNRVILCTDGDFNVGVTNRDELVRLVQARAREGVFLTVLGVGQDNLKDATMELLADKANGHYHYLDTIVEARKVLVEQVSGTLVTIAKDAKAQVEFNPARIAAWRQLGYEKRQLAAQDFANDRKDGGEIGADHLVTVLYELVPAGLMNGANAAPEDGLRYQPQARPAPVVIDPAHSSELLTVKLRYKSPTGSTSRLVQGVVTDDQVQRVASSDQRFAGAVAAFAMRLRGADAMGLEFPAIASEARQALGHDPQGYRREFVQLIERAAALEHGPFPRE